MSIAARLERLPLTSHEHAIFLVIATAWFFDSVDLGTLTFVLGSIKTEFQLSTGQTGLFSSMSFLGMFFGAAVAEILADRFARTVLFPTSMILLGRGQYNLSLLMRARAVTRR